MGRPPTIEVSDDVKAPHVHGVLGLSSCHTSYDAGVDRGLEAGISPGLSRCRRGWKSPMEQGVRFGRHRFDLDTGRLWSGKREIKLTPKAAAVLKVLVTQAGQPVGKEDLFDS